jgi:hypothetical protein
MARDPAKIYAIGDAALQSIVDRSSSSGGSGGGNGGTGMDARVAKVEATIEHIQSDTSDIKENIRDLRRNATNDFRILFAAIIGVAIGLAGLMAKGFHWF